MITRPVTLADVAREAGTSASTASRALSGRGYVAADVRQRLLDVKAAIGVPSLYYASHLDATGEELDADDYAAVRRAWDAAAAAAHTAERATSGDRPRTWPEGTRAAG